MLKNLKRRIVISSMAIALSVTSLSATHVYARENEIDQTEESSSNIGVSPVPPDESEMQRGTSVPSKVWDIASNGKYDFSGSSHFQTLYTNYKFTGKNHYKVYVNNTGDSAITVTAKRSGKTYAMTKITAGKSGSFEFSNIKSSTEFYIEIKTEDRDSFSFNGYVK